MRKKRKQKWENPSGTRIYDVWKAMRNRCDPNKKSAVKRYVSLGVCAEWESYDRFFQDMGPRPEGTSLDRIDNTKGYYPENCRWASMKEQMRNRSDNRWITHNGQTLPLCDWAEKLGIRADTLSRRLSRMSPERALVSGDLRDHLTWDHGTRAGYERNKCRCNICKAYNTERAKNYRRGKND